MYHSFLIHSFADGSILISYSYWSSGHLPLPPDHDYHGHPFLTQKVSPWCFQSLWPTAMFLVQHWQLRWSISDPVGREQGEGGLSCGAVFTKPTVGHSDARGLHTHLPLSHWHPEQPPALQAPFTMSAFYRCDICYFMYNFLTISSLYLGVFDTKILTVVFQLPTVFSSNMLYRCVV